MLRLLFRLLNNDARNFQFTNEDLFISNQTSFFTACALVLFVMVKYKISSGTKSLPSIQAEAIAAAIDNDAADDTAFKERKNDVCSDVNPIQKLFRRHSSITMKHCPYTNGTHVVYECPSCFAKVSDSAWHQSHACARTGGGAFFTLRDRLATLMDITEDIDEVRIVVCNWIACVAHVQINESDRATTR